MEYAVELSLQGGAELLPIVDRVLLDMGEMRDGPGEEEMEGLLTALTPLLSLLLEQLGGLPETATLDLGLEGDPAHVKIDLRLTAAGAPALPPTLIDPLLPALQQAFDQVEGPGAAGGAAFHLVLTRHHTS